MTVSMTGEPLVGPTYAVPSVSCRGREVDSRGETVLFVRVGAEEDLQRVPARAVSEDSEVLDVGDQGTLVLLESVARRLGWVEEERAAGSCIANNPLLYNSALSNIEALRANQRRTFLEVRALADAAAERRLDKLPCTREGAKTALSLTFQVWAEWQDPSPYPLFPDPIETCALDGKTRPEVGLLFLEWVRGLLPGILAECLPDAPSSGASAGSDPTDAGQVRAAVLSGAPVFLGYDANANPTAHVVKVARAIQRELKKGESNGELYSTCSELEDEVERLTAVLADRDRNHEEHGAIMSTSNHPDPATTSSASAEAPPTPRPDRPRARPPVPRKRPPPRPYERQVISPMLDAREAAVQLRLSVEALRARCRRAATVDAQGNVTAALAPGVVAVKLGKNTWRVRFDSTK